jgi:hypothetical protein
LIFLVLSLIALLSVPNCKTSEDLSEFTLTVTVGEGIDGTPATGTYSYKENVVVTYSYSPQVGYRNLEVTLDGVVVASNGSIPITANHTLTVTAEKYFDVRGDWAGILTSNGNKLDFKATFSGDLLTGNVSMTVDFSSKGSGPYSVSGSDISFNGKFSGSKVFFVGSVIDFNHMEGTWEFPPSSTSGPWELDRK